MIYETSTEGNMDAGALLVHGSLWVGIGFSGKVSHKTQIAQKARKTAAYCVH